MKNLKKVILGISLMLVMSSAMALPRNSYILRPAPTKESFLKQLKSEPVLMDRYMRHFSMTKSEVVAYISSLKLGRLEKTGLFQVFGVPKDGVIHANMYTLKKGTLMWFDAQGNPALVEVCGNPVTLGPKTNTLGAGITAPPETAATSDIVAMSTIPATPVTTSPLIAEVTPLVPLEPTAVDPVRFDAPRSRNNLGGLLILPALAGLVVNNRRDPVPEPATMSALVIGFGTLAARRRAAKA